MSSRSGTIGAALLAGIVALHAGAWADDVGRYATRYGQQVSRGALTWVRDLRLWWEGGAAQLADQVSTRYAVPIAFAKRASGGLADEAGASTEWVSANLEGAVRDMATRDGIDDVERVVAKASDSSPFTIHEAIKSTVCSTVDQLLDQRWDMASVPRIDVLAIASSYFRSSSIAVFSTDLATVADAIGGIDEIIVSKAKAVAAGKATSRTPETTRMRLLLLARCLDY
jgi:hypothetical protein